MSGVRCENNQLLLTKNSKDVLLTKCDFKSDCLPIFCTVNDRAYVMANTHWEIISIFDVQTEQLAGVVTGMPDFCIKFGYNGDYKYQVYDIGNVSSNVIDLKKTIEIWKNISIELPPDLAKFPEFEKNDATIRMFNSLSQTMTEEVQSANVRYLTKDIVQVRYTDLPMTCFLFMGTVNNTLKISGTSETHSYEKATTGNWRVI